MLLNGKRRALKRLSDFRKLDAVPISGKDVLLITQIAFYDDSGRFTSMVNKRREIGRASCRERV